MGGICEKCGRDVPDNEYGFRLQRLLPEPDGLGGEIDEEYCCDEPYFCNDCGETIHKENTNNHPIPPLRRRKTKKTK